MEVESDINEITQQEDDLVTLDVEDSEPEVDLDQFFFTKNRLYQVFSSWIDDATTPLQYELASILCQCWGQL